MDNTAFESDDSKDPRLKSPTHTDKMSDVEKGNMIGSGDQALTTTTTAASSTATVSPMGCNEACYQMHQLPNGNGTVPNMNEKSSTSPMMMMKMPNPTMRQNPWHRLKTIFLIGIIISLLVWIVVYTTLSLYEVL